MGIYNIQLTSVSSIPIVTPPTKSTTPPQKACPGITTPKTPTIIKNNISEDRALILLNL